MTPKQNEPVAWKWHQAPVKTSWGDEMVVAARLIDKDHTVSVYCEHDQTAKVEAMFTQPQQEAKDEPVAWMYEVNHAHTCLDLFEPPDDAYDEGTFYPLYTTPPQRKPLTDDEVLRLLSKIDEYAVRLPRGLREFARAIEAAHGIKGEA